jgi:hypothetical protein
MAGQPPMTHVAHRLARPSSLPLPPLPLSRDVLCGRSLRLRHGWVGVVNRGQADINKKMNMAEARSRESEFFRVSGGGLPKAACQTSGSSGSSLAGIRPCSPGPSRLFTPADDCFLFIFQLAPASGLLQTHRSFHPFPCLAPPPPGQSTDAYRDLDNTGTSYLANKLSHHLINEITRKLPEIQSYVDKT